MKHTREELKIIRSIKRSMQPLSVGKRILVNLGLFVAFLFFIGPILWIVLMSFKTQSQITSWPPSIFSSFTLENYASIFSRLGGAAVETTKDMLMQKKVEKFVQALINTAFLSVSSVAISLVVGVPAAYGLSRFKTKSKESLAMMFMSFRFVPELMTIIPLYLIYQKVGLYGTTFGLVWVYILISLPMIIWISRIGFDELPYNL